MKFVLTPSWFLGKDVLIEGFSFIILLAFFILCMRYYSLSKKRGIRNLGIGFLLIAIAQIATIMTKLVLYYDTHFVQQIGYMIISYNIVKSIDLFYYLGFFFHRALTLIGLYIIYRLPLKKKSVGEFFLVTYFLIISALFSANFIFLFHITALVLLVMITTNYSEIYKKNKSSNTRILIIAFSFLAFAHLLFTLSNLEIIFVLANIIELFSYTVLLALIIRLLDYGKKKK